MTLREAARKAARAQSKRHRYLSNLFGHTGPEADIYDDRDNEDLYPSNRYFPITLYYDPDRISTKQHRGSLFRHVKRLHRRRVVRMQALDPKALRRFSVNRSPRFESLFLERGYATDIEGRMPSGKRRPKSFKMVKANKLVLQANAHLWTNMLADQSEHLFKRTPEDCRDLAAPMLGLTERDGRYIPLVEYKDIFLGTNHPVGYPFHLAWSTTPAEAMNEGQRGLSLLFNDLTQDANEQVEFEFSNAHLLFGSGRRTSVERRQQTSAAVLVWFGQVIAAQRRVVWDVEMRRKWPIALGELAKEQKRHARVLGAHRLPTKPSLGRTIEQQIDEEKEKIRGHAEDAWNGYRPDCIHEISLDERLLAVLHGSAVDSASRSEHDFLESKEYLIVLARWIGELKRMGFHTFDEHIARCLRLGWSFISQGDNCLLGQFPRETWLKLISMAGKETVQPSRIPNGLPRRRIDGYAGRVDVTYEWGPLSVAGQPAMSVMEDGTLALRGPLLCFPIDQLVYWKRKAKLVSELGGFLAPNRRALARARR